MKRSFIIFSTSFLLSSCGGSTDSSEPFVYAGNWYDAEGDIYIGIIDESNIHRRSCTPFGGYKVDEQFIYHIEDNQIVVNWGKQTERADLLLENEQLTILGNQEEAVFSQEALFLIFVIIIQLKLQV